MAATLALVLLLTTLALTYSRGGLLVLVAALALLIGHRARAAAPGARPPAVGIAGSIPPDLSCSCSDDLTTDGLPVSARSGRRPAVPRSPLVVGLAIAVVLALRLGARASGVVLERAGRAPGDARRAGRRRWPCRSS